MFPLLFYYLVLPFLASFLVIRLIKKNSRSGSPEDVRRLFDQRPMEKGFFRLVRRDHKGAEWLGDFEKQEEAVDKAYAARGEAIEARKRAAFVVYNDKAEALEEVDC